MRQLLFSTDAFLCLLGANIQNNQQNKKIKQEPMHININKMLMRNLDIWKDKIGSWRTSWRDESSALGRSVGEHSISKGREIQSLGAATAKEGSPRCLNVGCVIKTD